jgi:hypothetical protein
VELGGVSASATGRNGGNVGKRMKKKRLLSLRGEERAREMRRARRAPVGDLYSIFLNLSRQTLWVNGCSMLASTFILPVYNGNVFGKNALMEVCHAGVRAA